MDGLDGSIYREQSNSHALGHVANTSSLGWAVDGVCDGFGDFLRFIAFGIILQRYVGNRKVPGIKYHLIDIEKVLIPPVKGNNESVQRNFLCRLYKFWLQYRQSIIVMVCISLQSLLSGIFWNYFIINYHKLLETSPFPGDIDYKELSRTQNEILRSSPMWMVCYFWRLVNPQNITQLQLLAILYGKEADLLLSVQLLGFLPPVMVGMGSFMHLQIVSHAVRRAALTG